jgi:hypothetical protein
MRTMTCRVALDIQGHPGNSNDRSRSLYVMAIRSVVERFMRIWHQLINERKCQPYKTVPGAFWETTDALAGHTQ